MPRSAHILAATIIALVAVFVLVPFGTVAARILLTPGLPNPQLDLSPLLSALLRTGLYAAIVGLISTILAIPGAWVLADRSRIFRSSFWTVAIIGGGLLLPSYIPYAGWGLLRGPDTFFGDLLARHHPSISVGVGQALALVGMALWCWPLAAVVLSLSVRGLGAGVLDSLWMESSGPHRVWEVTRVLKGGLMAAAGCVGFVVFGSAIPLNVSQTPTYAIELWKTMQLGKGMTDIWIAAAPLVLVAGLGAWVIGRRVMQPAPGRTADDGIGGRGRWAAIGLLTVWALTVLAPLGLFIWSLRSWRSVGAFWSVSGPGVRSSAEVAAMVGIVGGVLTLVTWACVSDGRWWMRRAAGLGLFGFLFSGLMPGVLLGAACAGSWGSIPLIGQNTAIQVMAHAARFGFVGLLAGWWLAGQEATEERWMRELDAGRSIRAWAVARVRPRITTVVGVVICTAALSFHEIESTVMVAPPGGQNLAQQVLDMLHYARDEQLSAAAINLLGIGVVLAMLGAGFIGLGATSAARRGRVE